MPANALERSITTARTGVVLSDLRGTVLYANDAAARQTGFSVNEIIGRTPGKLWGGLMPRSFYRALWTTIEDKKEPFVATVTNQRKDKTRYAEVLAIAPIASADPPVPAYYIALQMGSVTDIAKGERFRETFSRVLSARGGVSEQERLRYLMSVMNAKHAVPMREQSLFDLFREALVTPFEERFRTRTEDRMLVLSAQADTQQFQALYDKYRHTVYVYFLKHIGGNAEMAEDLTHDTFYRALRYFKDFRLTNASYGTYLLRVAHNVLVNYFRKQQFLLLMEEPSDQVKMDTNWFPEDLLWRSTALMATERKVLYMKYQEGFSVREIATALNKSENAVKLHLSRARKKLRVALKG